MLCFNRNYLMIWMGDDQIPKLVQEKAIVAYILICLKIWSKLLSLKAILAFSFDLLGRIIC